MMTLLRGLDVQELSKAELTGDWEFKLREMEHGRLTRDKFMSEIKRLTTDVVTKTREHAHIAKTREYPDLAVKCPVCGAESLKQTDKFFQCRGCEFKMGKMVASRLLNEAEVIELLTQKQIGPLDNFRNKFGAEFSAMLVLDKDMKVGFQFQKTEVLEAAAAAIADQANALCPCPVCAKAGRASMIYETDDAYVCESVVRGDRYPNSRRFDWSATNRLPLLSSATPTGDPSVEALAPTPYCQMRRPPL